MDSIQTDATNATGQGYTGPYDLSYPHLDKTFARLQAGKLKEEITGFEQPKSLADLLANDLSCYEFSALAQIFNWHESKDFITKCKECNIYTDVAPFSETAVINTNADNKDLSRAQKLDQIQEGQYINACYIKSSNREADPSPVANVEQPYGLIIATQGPKSNTIDHFWTMVLQQNVQKIVTLCQQIGDGQHADAKQYFPPEGTNEMQLEAVTLKIVEIKKIDFLIYRLISIVDKASNKELMRVEHHHFKGWADWQVPVDKSMTAYQELIQNSVAYVEAIHDEYRQNAATNNFNPRRLLVHCRAGIGRTGTTIALINMVLQLNAQIAAGTKDPSKLMLSPFSTVRQLREQRVYMVQTDNQYEFIYQFLQNFKIK